MPNTKTYKFALTSVWAMFTPTVCQHPCVQGFGARQKMGVRESHFDSMLLIDVAFFFRFESSV